MKLAPLARELIACLDAGLSTGDLTRDQVWPWMSEIRSLNQPVTLHQERTGFISETLFELVPPGVRS